MNALQSFLLNPLKLAMAAERLLSAVQARHCNYVASTQRHDGGFPGRRGAGDLYYTGFAVRALAMLNRLSCDTADRTAGFLKMRLGEPMPIPMIDFLSLVNTQVLLEDITGEDLFAQAGMDRQKMLLDFVEPYRAPNGGYSKKPNATHASTYHTFLVTMCKRLIGAPEDDKDELLALLQSRRRADGGFVELGAIRHSGTNPTAAAMALLRLHDAVDDATRDGCITFLKSMQNAEGGLRANTKVPVADLLSTFTGLLVLADLDALQAIDTQKARQFVTAMENDEGGFRAGVWDDAVDIEYTFYGLGAMALLAGVDREL